MSPTGRIHSISLRLWLPLLFTLALTTVTATFLIQDLNDTRRHLQRDAIELLRLINAQTALPLRRALENGRQDDLRALISSLSVHDDITWALLSDPQGKVIEASRYAWRGRKVNSLLPPNVRLSSAFEERGLHLITQQESLLVSVKIIDYIPEEGTLEPQTALLWVALDLTPRRTLHFAELRHHTLLMLGLSLAVLLVAYALLRRYVSTPLARLQHAANAIASGLFDTRLEVHGRGEVAQLGRSMDHMARHIRGTIEALRESEQRLSITLDAIGDAVLVTDPQGLITRLNPIAERLTGWSNDEARGRPVLEVFHIVNSETREPAEHPVGRVLREGLVVGLANHTTLIARDGREHQIADSAAPIRAPDGQILGVIMVFQDVTERYALEAEIRRVKDRLEAILASLPDLCLILDAAGRYQAILGGPQALLVQTREQLLGRRVDEVLPPEQAGPILTTIRRTLESGQPQRLEYSLPTLSGVRHFEGLTAPLHGEEENSVIWLARDQTERKRAEEQLQRMARYDQLTGLANRALAGQYLEEALSRNRRNGRFGALMFIDIDRFKNINDSLGHHLGDRLLIKVSEALRELIRSEDLAARFGGDEFVVILGDLGDDPISASAHAEAVAEKLRQACAVPFSVEGQTLQVTISIGIVLYPDDEAGSETLFKRADIAMYKAKDGGRNRICFFSPELQRIAETRLQVQHQLRHALKEDQFTLHIQPRSDDRGRWTGGEALIRWRHPQRGLLPPTSFIPIAEATGLIDDIDAWVLQHAITALGRIQHKLPPGFDRLSLNITADLLLDLTFPERLRHWCMEAALPPERLELEITERILVEDSERAERILDTLTHDGFHFSIDDFGTGYSSLRYLQRLPIHALKIDRSFIERLPDHQGDGRLVTTIIDLAQHLGLDVIAEGVEHTAQLEFLQRHGCRRFQGFLFAEPLPWDDFFQRLERHEPEPLPQD